MREIKGARNKGIKSESYKRRKTGMSEKKNIKQVIFLVTVMLTTIIVMADLPVYVIVNNLYTEFTDQVGTVNFIVSGTALTVMLSSLICAGIMQKIGKKNTLWQPTAFSCFAA